MAAEAKEASPPVEAKVEANAAEVKTEAKTEANAERIDGEPENETVPAAAAAAAATATEESPDAKPKRPNMHPGGKTVIVKNLPAGMLFTYEEELKRVFEKYGPIRYIKRGGIPIYYNTVEPTLSAYVYFENSNSSEQALAERGTILGGNPIEIDILRAGEHTVVISNLPYVIAKECLYKLLSPCGAIKDIVKIPARPTAFVEFEDDEGTKKALSLNGSLLINNIQVAVQRRGGPDAPAKKSKKNVAGNKRGNTGAIKRGARGGMARGGGRSQPNAGGFNSWDGGQQMGYRGPPRGNNYNSGGMPYNNNWGNGGNYRDNNMDERPFKRRKQNDWLWY